MSDRRPIFSALSPPWHTRQHAASQNVTSSLLSRTVRRSGCYSSSVGSRTRSLWNSFRRYFQLPEVHQVIIESVRIAAMPAKCEQLLRALVAWAGPTAVESGCLSCRVLQESSAPQAFCYQAQWKTHDDLLRHIRTDHYKRLLALMELGTTPPLVEFHTVTETRGLDLIECTRKV